MRFLRIVALKFLRRHESRSLFTDMEEFLNFASSTAFVTEEIFRTLSSHSCTRTILCLNIPSSYFFREVGKFLLNRNLFSVGVIYSTPLINLHEAINEE